MYDKKKKLALLAEAQYHSVRRRNEAWAMCGWLPVPVGYYCINKNSNYKNNKAPSWSKLALLNQQALALGASLVAKVL